MHLSFIFRGKGRVGWRVGVVMNWFELGPIFISWHKCFNETCVRLNLCLCLFECSGFIRSDCDQILPPDLCACNLKAIYHCSWCLRLALHDLSPWLSLSTVAWYFPSLLGRASKSSFVLLLFFYILFFNCLLQKNPPFLFHLTLNGL